MYCITTTFIKAALHREEGLHPISIDTIKNSLLLATQIKENQCQPQKLIDKSIPKVRIGIVLDKIIETIVEHELKNNDWEKSTNEYLFKRISQKISTIIDP